MPALPYPLGCLILASGFGQRFGSNKLLTEFHGRPLLQYILDSTDGLFARRVVVTRHAAVAKLCHSLGISYLLHSEPYLSDTVRLGTAWLTQQEQLAGLLCATSDQPLLQCGSLLALSDSFMAQPTRIHRLYWQDTPGNPIIFPSALFSELQQLPQDKGGSVLAKKYPGLVVKVQVRAATELYDIDTKADLAELVRHQPV